MANSGEDPFIGQQFGDYVIQALLGKGGMARVYRGIDPNINRVAAIKVVDPGVASDAEYTRRFKREAQAVAKLNHPHIVGVEQYGVERGIYYMAMAYIDGIDVERMMKHYRTQGRPFTATELLTIMSQLTAALDYAHCQGVIHRDVKPGNIMVTRQGHTYLTDFGLVRDMAIPTLGEIFGSPDYISPEQAINSAKAVPQSDLYSLGVVVYEILAGRLPFTDAHPNDIALMHIQKTPPSPRTFNPAVPPSVEAVVMKMLAKNVSERYQTGAAMFEAIRQAMQPYMKG